MALLIAYTLHDVKALAYSPPFFATNDQVAKRMLADLVADLNTTVGRHPSDYKMYKVGTFDESNGVLTPFGIAEHVVDCIALVPPPPAAADMFAGMMKRQAETRANGEAA